MRSDMITYIRQSLRMRKHGFRLESSSLLLNDFNRWKKLSAPGTSSVKERLPWMTFASIRFLESTLTKSMKVFEYGCGGSTVFLSERAGKVISVEHDKEWFRILGEFIQQLNLSNWEGKLVEPEYDGADTKQINDPEEYGTDDKVLSKYRFRNYASAIDEYPDQSFDFIFVDGRSRPSCMKHAMNKVKSGGYLLLDNSDRNYYFEKLQKDFYKKFHVVCDAAGPAPFMHEFSRTTIWQRNKS